MTRRASYPINRKLCFSTRPLPISPVDGAGPISPGAVIGLRRTMTCIGKVARFLPLSPDYFLFCMLSMRRCDLLFYLLHFYAYCRRRLPFAPLPVNFAEWMEDNLLENLPIGERTARLEIMRHAFYWGRCTWGLVFEAVSMKNRKKGRGLFRENLLFVKIGFINLSFKLAAASQNQK